MKSMSHKTTSEKTPSKFAILSCVKPSDFRFATWLRSSHQEVFCEKGVLRNFTKFTGKHLCQSLFFNKVEGLFRTLRMTKLVLKKLVLKKLVKSYL